MFQNISCRLCINICNGHRSLYDEDGSRNEVYALTEKYFSSLLLNMEAVDQFTVICVECWRHIFEFHTFEQSVVLAQKMFGFNKRTSDEVEETQPKRTETNGQQSPKEVAEGIANFAPQRVIDCSVDQESDSDVEFVEYSKIPQDHESVTMTSHSTIPPDHGNVTCAEEAEESDEPHEEWEEFDDCVGVFTGGEFDVPASKTTEELPLPEQPEKSPTEPKELNSIEPNSNSNVNSTSDDDICIINAEEDNLAPQLPGNSSIDLNSNVNSTSDDEICIINAEEDSLAEKLALELGTGKSSKPSQSETPKEVAYETNQSNLPPTSQTYDELIAQWLPALECVLCRESCHSFSLLQLHFAQLHPHDQCHIVCCQQQFYHRSELEKHIRFHLDPTPFKCELCCKCFAKWANLRMHQRRVHPAGKAEEIRPRCRKCSKNLPRENSRGHHTECGCNRVRKTIARPVNHRDMIRQTGKQLLHICPFCPKTCNHRSNLYKHLNAMHRKEWAEKKQKPKHVKATTKDRKIRK